MTSNLHPLFQSILAPYQQRSIDIAEQAVKMTAKMVEDYGKMPPAEQIKCAPLLQEHIEKTKGIVRRMRDCVLTEQLKSSEIF